MPTLVESLFGCRHKRTTFPITVNLGRHEDEADVQDTYIVCLDCGKEFGYDWTKMKLVPRSAASRRLTKIRSNAA